MINIKLALSAIAATLLSCIIHILLVKMFNMIAVQDHRKLYIIMKLALIVISIFLPILLLSLSIAIHNNVNLTSYVNVSTKILFISNACTLYIFALALITIYFINNINNIIKNNNSIVDLCFYRSHAQTNNNNYNVYFAWFIYTLLVIITSLFILLSKHNIHYFFYSLFLTILHGVFIFGLL